MRQSPRNRPPAARGRFRTRALVATLLLTGVAALGFGRRAHDALLFPLVLRADAVDLETMAGLVERSSQPMAVVRALQRVQRVPHRQAAITLLREARHTSAEARALLLEAAYDPDAAVRLAALPLIAQRLPADAPNVLLPHVADADPEIRLAALRFVPLKQQPDALRLIASLLDHADADTAKAAAMALQKAAGQDFGIRFARAAALTGLGGSAPAGLRLPADDYQGLREWLAAQLLSPPSRPAIEPPRPARYPVADFQLEDLDGRPVRLSDLRGRCVLLSFWATWCTACLGEIPSLNELHQSLSTEFVVLGVALDEPVHTHDHHTGTEPAHADQDASARDHASDWRTRVKRAVDRHGIAYRVLLDPEMRVGRRFAANELPMHVLIDGSGRLTRRFVGPRPLPALRAMLAEAMGG